MAISAAALAAIGMGASSGSSLLNSWMQKRTAERNTNKTIAANKELAQYAYKQDRRMWDMQNAYNDPKAQMSRLKSAGLNPHLVYGTGTVTGNQSGATPTYNAPKVDYQYRPMELPTGQLSQFTDTMLGMAQVDNVKAQTAKIEADTINSYLSSGLIKANTAVKSAEAWLAEQTNPSKAQMQYYNTASAGSKSREDERSEGTATLRKKQLELTTELQEMRLKWEKIGITPQDKLYIRVISKILPPETLRKVLGTTLYNQLIE